MDKYLSWQHSPAKRCCITDFLQVTGTFVQRFRDHSVNRDAVKALVAVYGPREAARQSGLPPGTVFSWCRRYKWKKAATLPRTNGINGMSGVVPRDAGDAITEAMAKHREESTLNLAKFTAKASKQAANLKNPLEKARAVRDVATVYSTLWPPEDGGEMVEGQILIGAAQVTDNHAEMIAQAEISDVSSEGAQQHNVRQELPDPRPESD